MTRVLPLLLGLTGCGHDVQGLWHLERLTVGGTSVDDAGFLDIQQDGAPSSSAPVVYLLRYTLTPDGALVPDPTPAVQQSTFDTVRYLEDGATLEVEIQADPEGQVVLPALFDVPRPKNRRLLLEDADFPGGALTWELVR